MDFAGTFLGFKSENDGSSWDLSKKSGCDTNHLMWISCDVL